MRRYEFIGSAVRRAGLSAVLLFVLANAASAATVEVKVSDPTGRRLRSPVALVPSNRQVTSGDDGIARFENVAPGATTWPSASGFMPVRTDITVAEGSPVIRPRRPLRPRSISRNRVTVSPDARDTFESYQPASVLGGEDLQQRLGNTLGATLASSRASTCALRLRQRAARRARPRQRPRADPRERRAHRRPVEPVRRPRRHPRPGHRHPDRGGARAGDAALRLERHRRRREPRLRRDRDEARRGRPRRLHGAGRDRRRERGHRREPERRQRQGRLSGQRLGPAHGRLQHARGQRSPTASRTRSPAAARSPSPATTASSARPTSTSTRATACRSWRRAGRRSIRAATGWTSRRERATWAASSAGSSSWAASATTSTTRSRAAGEIATSFKNKVTEGNLYLNQRALGPSRARSACAPSIATTAPLGEEALAPPTIQKTLSGFFYEELTYRHVSVQFGGRLDHTSFDPDGAAVERPDVPKRDFTNFSGLGRASSATCATT